MPRRKRNTISSASAVGGCLWRVGSKFSDHHVLAEDDQAAIETYHAIPEVLQQASKDPDSTKVIELKRLDTCVYGLPVAYDDDITQS